MNLDKRIIAIASIGMFLSMLDTGIVSIAIGDIVNAFHGDLKLGPYIIASYSILLCSTIIIFGYISTKYSVIHIFRIGIILFLISSLLCASSQSLEILIIYRGIQGVSAAMIQATAISLISIYISKKDKPKALANVITLASIGPIIAPSVGGIIIDNFSWAWLFYFNIPFCLVIIYLSRTVKVKLFEIEKLNKLNIYIYSIIFFIFMITLNLQEIRYLIPIPILLFISVLFYESRNKNGLLINKEIINNYYYLSLVLFLSLGFLTSFMFIVSPLKLLTNYDITTVSLITMILPLWTVIFSKISHVFIKKIGCKSISCIGFGLMAIGAASLFIGDFNNYHAIVSLSMFGIGCGLFQSANTLMLFGASRLPYHSISNSISRLFVNLGIAIGASLISILYI